MTNALAISPQGSALQNNLIEYLGDELKMVLPPTMRPERLILTIVQAGERNPTLYQAAPQSLMLAVLSMGVLNLEADGLTGQGYLLPFRVKGKQIIQPVIGYKGYNTLAARNGWTVTGQIVREGDRFEYAYGTNPHIDHRPKDRNRGSMTHAWACASKPGFAPIVEVLDFDQVMAIKGRSSGARRSDSPWNDTEIGFPAMAAKSARRRLARSLPIGWANTGNTMEDQWDIGKPAYVERDEDGSPAVVLASEYAAEPLHEAPPEGVLDGEVVLEWPIHIPGRKTQVCGSAGAWAKSMSRKLKTNANSPNLEEFWTGNAEALAQLGEVDEAAAEKLVRQYKGMVG